jgi:hypothetical protein
VDSTGLGGISIKAADDEISSLKIVGCISSIFDTSTNICSTGLIGSLSNVVSELFDKLLESIPVDVTDVDVDEVLNDEG